MSPELYQRRTRGYGGRHLAGVADQDNTCPNGTEGCPGPNAGATPPCAKCFFQGGETA